MTTTDVRSVSASHPAVAAASAWRDELERFLRPAHFPARLDQLLSTLARRQAPSRIYWRLASLPLSRTFDGLPDLIASLEAQPRPLAQPEPI